MEDASLDLGAALSGAAAGIFEQLSPALTAAIPVALAVIGVTVGFKLFRRFARG